MFLINAPAPPSAPRLPMPRRTVSVFAFVCYAWFQQLLLLRARKPARRYMGQTFRPHKLNLLPLLTPNPNAHKQTTQIYWPTHSFSVAATYALGPPAKACPGRSSLALSIDLNTYHTHVKAWLDLNFEIILKKLLR